MKKRQRRFPQWVKVGRNGEIDPSVRLGVLCPRLSGRPSLVLGSDVVLRSGTVLYAGSRIGKNFQTGHNAIIREENEIADDVSVWSNSVVDYGCRIGRRVKIHCNCYVAQYTELEEDVFLGPGTTIANDLYPGREWSANKMKGPYLERGVRVGINATILPYVRIGCDSLIGAGAVVTKDVPAGSVVVGNPARVLCSVQEVEPTWREKVLKRAS